MNIIESIQAKLGITVDGVAGPLTLAAIAKALGVVAQPASPATTPSVPAASGIAFDKIIDLNHANGLDLGKLLPWGLGAVIHKATEGMEFADPKYNARKSACMSAGLLFGAYHFASGGDGIEQARHFLSVEPGTDPNILLCLDFEPSSGGRPNMTLAEGRDFLRYVHDKTGRWPMVYGGGGLLRDLLDGKSDDIFGQCPLWLADYRTHPQTIMPTWPKWTLLQYSDEGAPGSDGADLNSFAGSLDELRAAWPFARA